MKLELENIGKIRSANIVIDGITVIAGENDTGKSTVGKTLYSIFNSFYSLDKQIVDARRDMTKTIIEDALRDERFWGMEVGSFADEIVSFTNSVDSETEKRISDKIKEYIALYAAEDADKRAMSSRLSDNIINRTKYVLNVDNSEIFKNVLQRRIDNEFKKQIVTIGSGDEESRICLSIKDDDIESTRLVSDIAT